MPTYRVTIRSPGHPPRTLRVPAGEYVLEAALARGLSLPHRCLQGWCLTCAVRVVEGVVDQRDARRYYEADRAGGFALICTGRPCSDLVLDSPARTAMRAARARLGLPFPRGDWGDERAPEDRGVRDQ